MTRVALVTASADPVIATADVAAHCRVLDSNEDTTLAALTAAAAAWLEGTPHPGDGWLGRSLLSRTLRWESEHFPAFARVVLPYGPVSAITSVAYTEPAGATVTVSPSDYFLVGDCLHFVEGFGAPSLYPRSDAFRVTYAAGHENAAALPKPVRQAILLLVSHWYENREAVQIGVTPVALPMAVEALLAPYRRW